MYEAFSALEVAYTGRLEHPVLCTATSQMVFFNSLVLVFVSCPAWRAIDRFATTLCYQCASKRIKRRAFCA